jgi:hypothetical protein
MTSVVTSAGRPSNSLHFIVGEMSGKLDQVLMALLDDRQQTRQGFEDVGRRLAILEKARWRIVGGGSVVLFLIGSVEAIRYVSGR